MPIVVDYKIMCECNAFKTTVTNKNVTSNYGCVLAYTYTLRNDKWKVIIIEIFF